MIKYLFAGIYQHENKTGSEAFGEINLSYLQVQTLTGKSSIININIFLILNVPSPSDKWASVFFQGFLI